MIITVLPWIFGSKKNVPDTVKDLIFPNPRYEAVKKSVIQEEKRLMYVAMTRPVESLLLAVNQDNGLLRLKQMRVNAVDTIPDAKKFDVLGINKDFIIENPANIENWKFKTQENKVINFMLNHKITKTVTSNLVHVKHLQK